MEGVAITAGGSAEFWSQRRVLLTGHTGFKGSWLSLWLNQVGAHVTGLALRPPTEPSLFELAEIARGLDSLIGDVRDPAAVAGAMERARPEVVIHMAAQPLVRTSYADPIETYSTNVMGTVNVLDAVRRCSSVRAVVVVTTDKVYENHGAAESYREGDPLGGHDPYSSSKTCAEIATASWRRSFFELAGREVAIATARAGNVIGGGDWAVDRLVPDLVRGAIAHRPVPIRNPAAVRPWQHVLEPLGGYLRLAAAMWHEPARYAGAWNFGPVQDSEATVAQVVEKFAEVWGAGATHQPDPASHPHETAELRLDTSKARGELGWEPRLTVDEAIEWTVDWYKAYVRREELRSVTERQIDDYQKWQKPASAVA